MDKVSTISDVKVLLDTYGVAVRAGAITPQSEDEVYFRSLIGLPEASNEVLEQWKEIDNVKNPITLNIANNGGSFGYSGRSPTGDSAEEITL